MLIKFLFNLTITQWSRIGFLHFYIDSQFCAVQNDLQGFILSSTCKNIYFLSSSVHTTLNGNPGQNAQLNVQGVKEEGSAAVLMAMKEMKDV